MILTGNKLIITTSSGVIAAAKSFNFHHSQKQIETSSPYSGDYETYKGGRHSWNVSVGTLVLSERFTAYVLKVGTDVTLTMKLPISALPNIGFLGIYDLDDIFDTQARNNDGVYWSSERNCFVCKDNTAGHYYMSWANMSEHFSNPKSDSYYINLGASYAPYMYTGQTLVRANMIQGVARVTDFDIQSAVGSLAQGSFQFLGNGALSAVDLW